jgi:hypothetical protein
VNKENRERMNTSTRGEEKEGWRRVWNKKIHPGGHFNYLPGWTVGDLADRWLSLSTWKESEFTNQRNYIKIISRALQIFGVSATTGHICSNLGLV